MDYVSPNGPLNLRTCIIEGDPSLVGNIHGVLDRRQYAKGQDCCFVRRSQYFVDGIAMFNQKNHKSDIQSQIIHYFSRVSFASA